MDTPAISLEEELDREAARKTYPEGFPALPPMPAGRYTEERFHQLELAHLWRKTWLYAAHVTELPEPGSYKLFERLGLSIIVNRGADGEIRAFHNICRHRASPVLIEKCGKAKRLVCPYHAWTYGIDGALIATPEAHNFDRLDKSSHGLMPVRCETWRGLVYVNLDPAAAPLQEYLEAIPDQLADGFPLEEMEVKRFSAIEIACNWKAAYDNFLESYHVPTIHARTIMPWLAPETFSIRLLRNGHSRYTVRRTVTVREAGPDSPNLPGASDTFRRNTVGLIMFPNMIGSADPGGFPWVNFWPEGPDKVVMTVQLMGWRGDKSDHWDELMRSVLTIFGEDADQLARLQTSLKSGFVTGMPLSYTERIIYWYHEHIDRVIGCERIPPALRMVPVLERFAQG